LQCARSGLAASLKRHPIFYSLIGVLIVLFAVLTLIFRLPRLSWRYDDMNLPVVTQIQLHENQADTSEEGLLFLSRANGWVTLKRRGTSRYVMIREDKLTRLELTGVKRRLYSVRQ
jgi:hypothetical protein